MIAGAPQLCTEPTYYRSELWCLGSFATQRVLLLLLVVMHMPCVGGHADVGPVSTRNKETPLMKLLTRGSPSIMYLLQLLCNRLVFYLSSPICTTAHFPLAP